MDRITVEQLVLSSCMKDAAIARDAVARLTPEHFIGNDRAKASHPKYLELIKILLETPEGLNRVSLTREVERLNLNINYFGDLMKLPLPSVEEVNSFIVTMVEDHDRAVLDRLGREISMQVLDRSVPIERITSLVQREVDKVGLGEVGGNSHISTVGNNFLAGLDKPQDKILTGFIDVDTNMGGMAKQESAVLAGLPGTGKTSLALAWGYNIAKSGRPVAFYGYEMSADKMYEKLVAHHSLIPYFILEKRPPHILARYKEKIVQGKQELDQFPIYMQDQEQCPTFERLKESIARNVEQNGVQVVIIDYLQLVAAMLEMKEYDAVTKVSQELNRLADKHNVFLLNLCQLSRSWEKREDGLPRSSDLRSSGQLEQDAAYIFFVLRRQYGDKFFNEPRSKQLLPIWETMIYRTKNRFDTTGQQQNMHRSLAFIPGYSKYVNVQWDTREHAKRLCPRCGGPEVKWDIATRCITCSACNHMEVFTYPESRGGFDFRTIPGNIYGKPMQYDFAFLQDGYHGDSIARGIGRLQRAGFITDDGEPFRRPTFVTEAPEIIDVEGDIIDDILD